MDNNVTVAKIPDQYIDTTESSNPASANDIVSGYVAYVNGSKVTGTLVPGGDEPIIDDLTITPTKSIQTFNSPSIDGYKPVIVGAIPNQYVDTSDANATSADILYNKTSYVGGSKVTGSMPNNGSVTQNITSRDQTISVPAGYTSGGNIAISSADRLKLVGGNIKQGTTILGVQGTYSGGGSTPVIDDLAVTPTKNEQTFNSSSVDGYKPVVVAPIPDRYIDTTDANAVTTDILNGKTGYVNGSKVTGTMPDNGAVSGTIRNLNDTVTIPSGKTSGGTVSLASAAKAEIVASHIKANEYIMGVKGTYEGESTDPIIESLNVTPTKSAQTFNASSVDGYKPVTINAIPSQYIDTTDATAVRADILNGKTAYVNGSKITGNMANNGAVNGTITTPNQSVSIPAGYTSGGSVAINSTDAAKIISANIKSGVTILGVAGSLSPGGGGLPDPIVAGDTPVLGNCTSGNTISSTSYASTGLQITIKQAGVYRFKYVGYVGTATNGNAGHMRLYKNNTAVGSDHSMTSSGLHAYSDDITCAAGDTVQLRAYAARSISSYYVYPIGLIACINWDNGL